MKDYERIAKSNCWDTTMKLANAQFFLEGTAGQWYDNNEEGIDLWDMFKEMFSRTFDNSDAKDNLQNRSQKSTESCESYIQDVLSLCRQVNPNMTKEEKVAHLLKGVVEDVYQVILVKEIDTVEAFVDWCRKVEACKQRRIGKPSIEQPNSSSLEDLIRPIVREEIKSTLQSESIMPEVNSLRKIIHEEVERNLTPIAEQGPYYREQRCQFEGPAKPPSYYQQQNPTRLTTARRKTDEWRTVDNIPVCFQCGRPGHVARYCRKRRGMVDRRPPGRYHPVQNGPRTIYNSNETPDRARYRSPSPYPGRGRSPAERRPSISPSRRSGRLPYQIINPPPLIAAKLSQNIVDVTIDDKTFPALVDSGASFSVISDHFRQQHKKTMFSDAGMTLRVADGKYIVSRGPDPFEFVVLPSCSHDIILGWDFLEASRAIIDCGSAEILIFQTVATDDSFIILAGSTKQINVISEAILGVSDVVVEPSRILFLERDLMVPASIFAVQHGKGRIWITNIGTCDRTVPKGMRIGEIQVLEEGHLAVIGDASDTNRQGIFGQENSPNIASMINPDLSMLERTRICSILGSFSGLFEFNKFPSNLTSTAKHKINTEDHPPIKRRPYRVSQVERQTIQNEVDKMLKGGIVQLSESPWSSPVVLVKKKNGCWRFCVDYRHLNKITKKDVYPLPRIDDTLDCLRGASYYSSMDLRSGYWQIEVDEADREKNAFITPDGLY
ncbi:K02A2.6-like [Cordylochernes scorpioides]|uniref:K02A2.6-like n=1 Tax=Cordylochernes scorpioides TaxID=51811 RepID=A0ABY6LRM5_9ARAC|nr:K02A2.6-like [Cordylochernes scorpioides]